ncbi:MAG: hypothetical protein JNM88_16720, partial [Chitinophagaceae bacterium]|nr:hypothetical protein [Chitinophagaceae bacterium]
MKPTSKFPLRLFIGLLAVALTAGLVSWGGRQQGGGRYQQDIADTTPKKNKTDREKKVRDLDDVLDELNETDIKAELEKAQKELEEAMKNLNTDKIRMEVEKALKEVDFEKIQ